MNPGDIDPALMEWFLGGQAPRMKKNSTAPSPTPAGRGPRHSGIDREAELRALGVNRPEREALLRSRTTRRRQINRPQAIKRLEFYIDQWVDWNTTDLDRREVVAQWAAFVHHDVDKAKWWWEKGGVHPLQIRQLMEFIKSGFSAGDLGVVIDGGKTVLEHLLNGQPVKWCANSLEWHRRSLTS